MAQDTGTKTFTGTAPTVDSDDYDGLAFPFTRSAVQYDYLKNINLGLVQTITLGGTVWEEDTIDGLYQSSEDGVKSVKVTVYQALVMYDKDEGDLCVTTYALRSESKTTGKSGTWSISSLPLTLTEYQGNLTYVKTSMSDSISGLTRQNISGDLENR